MYSTPHPHIIPSCTHCTGSYQQATITTAGLSNFPYAHTHTSHLYNAAVGANTDTNRYKSHYVMLQSAQKQMQIQIHKQIEIQTHTSHLYNAAVSANTGTNTNRCKYRLAHQALDRKKMIPPNGFI